MPSSFDLLASSCKLLTPTHYFHSSHIAGMEETRVVYRVLVGKHKEKKPLVRPWNRWEDNIKMDLKEVGCGCVDWIDLVQDKDRWQHL